MVSFLKMCSFMLLMNGECKDESFLGHVYVAQVALEREMNILDKKQFNCFNESTIQLFEKAFKESSFQGKNTKKIIDKIYTKMTLDQVVFYAYIYMLKDYWKWMSDGSNYFMTKDAWEHVKVRYPKWARTLVKTKTEGNHIFLKGKSFNVHSTEDRQK